MKMKLILIIPLLFSSFLFADLQGVKRDTLPSSISVNGGGVPEIAKTISYYGNLKYLSIAYNQLVTIPTIITNHSSTLSHFDASRNSLRDINQVTFLVSLSYLDVRHNQIEIVPPGIGNLRRLESLYLGGNNISELPSTMANLFYLKHLDLSYNDFVKLPDFFKNLVNLKSLNLTGNKGLSNQIDLVRKSLPGVDILF